LFRKKSKRLNWNITRQKAKILELKGDIGNKRQEFDNQLRTNKRVEKERNKLQTECKTLRLSDRNLNR